MVVFIQSTISIYQDIDNVEVQVGGTVSFTIGADFADNYAWYGPGGLIADATGPVLTLINVGTQDVGEYYCQISNNCGTIVSNIALLNVYEEQFIIVPAGWSGISSWIQPYYPSFEQLFEPLNNNLVLIKNYEGVYYPDPVKGFNTLGVWETQSGYEIKVLYSDTVFFRGVTNNNRTISMSGGWNYLPVISSCLVNVQEAFGGLTSIDLIKEIAGPGIYWPAMNINTLVNLKPGKAYLLRANQGFSYSYPLCTNKSGFIPENSIPENPSNWVTPINTPSTHLVAFDDILLETFLKGDVIGAFTSEGLCAGIMEIQESKNALTLFADDIYSDESDGFTENENISFKLYRQATGEQFDLSVSFDPAFPNSSGKFATNGISRVFKAGINSIYHSGQDKNAISIYPNPTHGKVNITGLNNNSELEIYNSEGQLLSSTTFVKAGQIQPFTLDLSGYNTGVLYLRIVDQQTVEIKKVILQ
jgi:hypothetical protein